MYTIINGVLVIKGMDILLGMMQATPPSVLPIGGNVLSLPSVPPSLHTTPLSTGIPIHQVYEDEDFFLLVLYPPAKTVVTCKFSPLSVEVKAVTTSIDPEKLHKEFNLPKNFLAEFHAQRLHEERELTYTILFSSPIETSHQHIKKVDFKGCMVYYLPFEKYQEEFL